MHSQTTEKIRQLFAALQCRLYLLDMNGSCVLPGQAFPHTLPFRLTDGQIISHEGMRYLQIPSGGGILAAEEGTPDDLMRLAAGAVDALMAVSGSRGINGAYQRLLLDDLDSTELDALVSEYHIPAAAQRCVLLLYMRDLRGESVYDLLQELIPLLPGDILIPLDSNNAALIRPAAGPAQVPELSEFASALQETVLQETAKPLWIGISDTALSARELRGAYSQAKRAIEIGRTYHPQRYVFVYRTLLLERFFSELKPETAAYYHGLLFNRHTARLFNEEMLGTIEMFFEKDLNLSETARKLFIHRNTLVYRLDKIQQQTGLDLRRFDDAVTFRLLLEMKKRIPGQVKKTNP